MNLIEARWLAQWPSFRVAQDALFVSPAMVGHPGCFILVLFNLRNFNPFSRLILSESLSTVHWKRAEKIQTGTNLPSPTMSSYTPSVEDYRVAWITALPEELGAAVALLDKSYPKPQDLPEGDHNCYEYGRMFSYDVVIASLPSGVVGTNSVAGVASGLLRTFTNVKVGLMVGIAGGAPNLKNEIRLGDVVVRIMP